MTRTWTARKHTTFNEAALDPDVFANAYPLFRDGPTDPAAAAKEALGFVAGVVCLALPIHGAACWLAAASVALAAALGGAGVLGLLAVALARRLGLDDLLRRLPLVLLAAALLYGLSVLASGQAFRGGWGGPEAVGVLLVAAAVASVLASFHQPVAAAYRSVTQTTPAAQLLAAAGVLALSVGTAVLSRAVPAWAFALVAVVAVNAYAGLVLFEYAAWAKADPARDLRQDLAALRAARSDGERDRLALTPRQGRRVLFEAAWFGFLFGVFVVTTAALNVPGSELARFLAGLDGAPPEQVDETLGLFAVTGAVLAALCLATTSAALDGFRLPEHPAQAFLAWKPLVVFLTYPDTKHPLAHRLRLRWLRPQGVRQALTAGALLTVVSAASLPAAKPAAPPAPAAVAPAQPPTPPALARERPGTYSRDLQAAMVWGGDADWQPPPPPAPPPRLRTDAPAPNPARESGAVPVVVTVVLVLFAPPLGVYLAVCLLGVLVLPAYHRPAPPAAQDPPAQDPPAA